MQWATRAVKIVRLRKSSNFSVEVQVEDDHPYKLTATNVFHIRVMDINEPPSLITNPCLQMNLRGQRNIIQL